MDGALRWRHITRKREAFNYSLWETQQMTDLYIG